MAQGSTQPLTEMSTRNICGGKNGQCLRLTTLPQFWAIVMKSGNLNFLEPSGHLGPVMGLIYLLLVRNHCIFAEKTRLMGKSPSRKSMFCTQRSIQGRAKWSQVVTFSVHNCVRISVLLPHRSYTDGPPISSTYIVR